MTTATRRRVNAGAAATMSVAGKARAALLVRLGILPDKYGPLAENAGPGSVVAAKPAVEDLAKAQS